MVKEKRTKDPSPGLELPLQTHSLCRHPGPHTQRISVLGLVLCRPRLEVLSDLEQGAPYFCVAPGPTNDVASSAQDTSELRGLVEEDSCKEDSERVAHKSRGSLEIVSGKKWLSVSNAAEQKSEEKTEDPPWARQGTDY